MPVERVQEVRRLRGFVPHHTALHVNLLYDALILTLYSLFEKPGLDQKTGDSVKITLEHFIRSLPADCEPRTTAEKLLKEARSSSIYAQLCRARGDLIGHSNRKTLLEFVDHPSKAMFPDLGIESLGQLLRKAQQIAMAAIHPMIDFGIPGFHGADDLFEVVRAAVTPRSTMEGFEAMQIGDEVEIFLNTGSRVGVGEIASVDDSPPTVFVKFFLAENDDRSFGAPKNWFAQAGHRKWKLDMPDRGQFKPAEKED